MEGGLTNWDGISVEGQTPEPGAENAMRVLKVVSPGLFRTTGTRLVAGREFDWSDIYERHEVALVSESLARELWQDPAAAVGKRIRWGGAGADWREVVGVVAGHARQRLARGAAGDRLLAAAHENSQAATSSVATSRSRSVARWPATKRSSGRFSKRCGP